MHAFKGGWVGQTFALATHNDSGGKKARIRRSKEERKTMVETFIKKYQKSNDGNFPSLNLTHKEVGGSFYTVREIVREIIQENRVLGPAKLPIEEQNIDNLLEHSPLGSISIEPQPSLSPLNETQIISHITSDQSQGSSEELVESSEVLFHQPEHKISDGEQEANGTIEKVENYTEFDKSGDTGGASYPLEGTNVEPLLRSDCQKFDNDLVGKDTQASAEESNAPKLGNFVSVDHEETSQEHMQESSEDQVLQFDRHIPGHGHLNSNQQVVNGTSQATEKNDIDSLDVEKGGRKQLEASDTVRPLVKPDILVEKFPLRPVAKKIEGFEGASEVQCQVTRTVEVNGIEQDRVHVSKAASSLMNPEVGADMASQVVKESEPVDETSYPNVTNSSLECSNSSTTKETIVLDINDVAELGAKVSSPIEFKPVNSPTAFSGNVNKRETSFPDKKSMSQNFVGVKYKLNIEHKSSNQKGIESRFERINLETRKGASEKPASSEINPLLALFKAFVDAFVKFWSE